MSTWVRAHLGESPEIGVPSAGKAVWVRADGEPPAPPRPAGAAADEDEPPSTWLVPAFDLPPR